METKKPGEKTKSLSIKALVSALISLAFCAFLISATVINRTNIEKLRLEYERVRRLNDVTMEIPERAELEIFDPYGVSHKNITWYSHPDNIALILAGFFISLIVFLVMQNNYELKKMQAGFELMAITDHLTGIFNRRHFLEIVRINIEKARRLNEDCYFIMFDIDKFKDINDTYGHQIGDKVLMDVTARIKTNIRPYDLFARYGGEEFLIFTSGISIKQVCDMSERLRLSLCGRKYEYDNVSFNCSASFGIAHMIDYNLDLAIKQSDDAMYAAKRNGRNCVVYFNESEC